MKGAEAVLGALADSGVTTCFANPGTSEMQMVAALDRETRIRPVLCLFEGVATGAADGYGRVSGQPASTLLHLGPGLGNGLASLHNARRANSPVVNLIGEHATYHREFDSPLTSDIEAVAGTVSRWVATAADSDDAVRLASDAVRESMGSPKGVASLILPADAMWSDVSSKDLVANLSSVALEGAGEGRVDEVARAIRKAKRPAILLGSDAVSDAALEAAGRLAAAGYRVLVDSFVAILPRGEGRFKPERVPYFGSAAVEALRDLDLLVTVHSKAPVAFFGYPNAPSSFVSSETTVESLTHKETDAAQALTALADVLGAKVDGPRVELSLPSLLDKFNAHSVGAAIARHLPTDALVSEDAPSSGVPVMMQTESARRHDWMFLTGGAIGQALPVALGASVAAPHRKVVALSGDGAAAYSLQSLWTIANQGLDVTTIVFANHSYRILNLELERTESGSAGPRARQLLDLENPRIEWATLAKSMGVPAVQARDVNSFEAAFKRAMEEPGPHFIEVALVA